MRKLLFLVVLMLSFSVGYVTGMDIGEGGFGKFKMDQDCQKICYDPDTGVAILVKYKGKKCTGGWGYCSPKPCSSFSCRELLDDGAY